MNATQSDLFIFSEQPKGNTIQEQFAAFHHDNPWVYRELVKLAREAASRGYDHFGIGMLWEVLRWNFYKPTIHGEWKLNNNFRSRYVRLIVDSEPDLSKLFELRALKSP